MRWIVGVVLVSLLGSACVTHGLPAKVSPIGSDAIDGGLAHWFILTDRGGEDHILFCEAKPIHVEGAPEAAACFDMTPRSGGYTKPWGDWKRFATPVPPKAQP